MDRLDVIEVCLATPTRRVVKAYDRELRQVVSVTSELLGDRDGPMLLASIEPYLQVPKSRALAPLIDVFLAEDRIVLVSPWVEGVDLLAILVASGTPGLPVTAVLGWLDQVAEAVRHLHTNGLAHGDIRPANLILSTEQRVVVVGLGTGRLETDHPTTVSNDVRGVAATAVALLTGSSPTVGAISGTSSVSGPALQRALLNTLDSHGEVDTSVDDLLLTLRQELNAALPTGVVTFLLTDIAGSTAKWEANPVSMAQQLADHDYLMAEAVDAAGGRLLKARGEGDATFSVFTRASQAVNAALDAQQRVREQTELVVRMAIHTGEAELRAADYFGRTVNRAARLRSVAPDGGILLSAASADLVMDGLPDGVRLVDLGETALKDLDRAEHTYQIVSDHLPDLAQPTLPAPPLPGAPTITPPPPPGAPVGTATAPRPAGSPGGGARPSRRGLLVGAGLLLVAGSVIGAVVLGGGGDDGETATTSPGGGLGMPTIQAQLLGLSELGPDYVAIEPLVFGDTPEPCGQPNIDNATPPDEAAAISARNADNSKNVSEALRRYEDEATAEDVATRIVDSMRCEQAEVVTRTGETITVDVAPIRTLAVEGYDDALATIITYGDFAITMGVARLDDVVVVLQVGAFPDPDVDSYAVTALLLRSALDLVAR